MTRYTNLERKKYLKASGEFTVSPLVKPWRCEENVSEKMIREREKAQIDSAELGKDFTFSKKRKDKDETGVEFGKELRVSKKKRKVETKEPIGEKKDIDLQDVMNSESSSSYKVNSDGIKSKNAEKRRLRRVKERLNKTICFACRKPGHSVRDCRIAKERGVGSCYTCGSSEHTSKDCTSIMKNKNKKNTEGKYQFAKCFICAEQGHLSGQCPQNEKGLYPNGGSCRFCGKIDHLARDCTVKREEIGSTVLSKIDLAQGADDDDYHIFIEEKKRYKKENKKTILESSSAANKIKKKIVKF